MAQRRVGCDSRAEDRSSRCRVHARGNLEHEILTHDNDIRVAAEGVVAPVHVLAGDRLFRRNRRAVVGLQERVRAFAIVLVTGAAGLARLAAVHHAADADQVAHGVAGDARPDRTHAPGHLVAGHARIDRVAPIVLGLMDVRVADAAEQHLDFHLAGTSGFALEPERLQPRETVFGCVTDGWDRWHRSTLVGLVLLKRSRRWRVKPAR